MSTFKFHIVFRKSLMYCIPNVCEVFNRSVFLKTDLIIFVKMNNN